MRGVAVLAALILSACAGRTLPQSEGSRTALQTELADYAPRETQDCLPTTYDTATARAVDAQHIVYTRTRGEKWVSTLDAPCPGLRPSATLLIERFGSNVCRLDPVRDLGDRPTFIAGPRCPLGAFTRYERVR